MVEVVWEDFVDVEMDDRTSEVTASSQGDMELRRDMLENVSQRVSAIAKESSDIQRQYKELRHQRKHVNMQISALFGHSAASHLYERARRVEEQADALEHLFEDIRDHQKEDDKVPGELYSTLQKSRGVVHDLALRTGTPEADGEPPEEFRCSICMDLLYHPVMLDCGHRFCEHCVTLASRKDAHKRCPLCRQENMAGTFEEDTELNYYLKKTYRTLYKGRKADRTAWRAKQLENELTLYELRLQKIRRTQAQTARMAQYNTSRIR